MITIVDQNLCIGAAPCVAIAPEVFELTEEGKAIVINQHGTTDENIKLAAEACPVRAVFLYDEITKKQLYPDKSEINRPFTEN